MRAGLAANGETRFASKIAMTEDFGAGVGPKVGDATALLGIVPLHEGGSNFERAAGVLGRGWHRAREEN